MDRVFDIEPLTMKLFLGLLSSGVTGLCGYHVWLDAHFLPVYCLISFLLVSTVCAIGLAVTVRQFLIEEI